jgi:hypothetical protein
MKWFHHECAAKHDPKLQTLGAQHGAEGLGIFWGLLEEIGQHSETFHLKISGVSAIADRTFEEILLDEGKAPPELGQGRIHLRSVPRFPLKILAKILFTTPQKLERVVQSAVEIGLFERGVWQEYSILHSQAFERRADDYTRRVHRRHTGIRTASGQDPDQRGEPSGEWPKAADNVLPAQTDKDTEEMKKEQNRADASLTAADLRHCIAQFRAVLAEHNHSRVNPFSWNPTEAELERLFLGGDERHKEALCRAWGGTFSYPELVVRALKVMLESSERRRIANPAGWLWACLHGSADGAGPWIQMMRGNGASGAPDAATSDRNHTHR